MRFIYNDGGRQAAGFKGRANDCVARAIAIATELPYAHVYQQLDFAAAHERPRGMNKRSHPRTGVHHQTIRRYMTSLGWPWTPTMLIGSGCRVHLRADELPAGRLVVNLSKHVCAVIDGVIYDTHNPSERGTTIYPPYYTGTVPKGARWLENGNGWAYSPERCVYGYWSAP